MWRNGIVPNFKNEHCVFDISKLSLIQKKVIFDKYIRKQQREGIKATEWPNTTLGTE